MDGTPPILSRLEGAYSGVPRTTHENSAMCVVRNDGQMINDKEVRHRCGSHRKFRQRTPTPPTSPPPMLSRILANHSSLPAPKGILEVLLLALPEIIMPQIRVSNSWNARRRCGALLRCTCGGHVFRGPGTLYPIDTHSDIIGHAHPDFQHISSPP